MSNYKNNPPHASFKNPAWKPMESRVNHETRQLRRQRARRHFKMPIDMKMQEWHRMNRFGKIGRQ